MRYVDSGSPLKSLANCEISDFEHEWCVSLHADVHSFARKPADVRAKQSTALKFARLVQATIEIWVFSKYHIGLTSHLSRVYRTPLITCSAAYNDVIRLKYLTEAS